MSKTALRLILGITLCIAVCYFAAVDIHANQTNNIQRDNVLKDENIGKVNDVRALIYGWIDAWRHKDIEKYISFYSPKFQTKDYDYSGWLKKKSKLFQKPGKISVEIFYLGVFIKNDYAYASFIQKYKDRHHEDIGEKNMVWAHSNGKWEIVSEDWKRLSSEGVRR